MKTYWLAVVICAAGLVSGCVSTTDPDCWPEHHPSMEPDPIAGISGAGACGIGSGPEASRDRGEVDLEIIWI